MRTHAIKQVMHLQEIIIPVTGDILILKANLQSNYKFRDEEDGFVPHLAVFYYNKDTRSYFYWNDFLTG